MSKGTTAARCTLQHAVCLMRCMALYLGARHLPYPACIRVLNTQVGPRYILADKLHTVYIPIGESRQFTYADGSFG